LKEQEVVEEVQVSRFKLNFVSERFMIVMSNMYFSIFIILPKLNNSNRKMDDDCKIF